MFMLCSVHNEANIGHLFHFIQGERTRNGVSTDEHQTGRMHWKHVENCELSFARATLSTIESMALIEYTSNVIISFEVSFSRRISLPWANPIADWNYKHRCYINGIASVRSDRMTIYVLARLVWAGAGVSIIVLLLFPLKWIIPCTNNNHTIFFILLCVCVWVCKPFSLRLATWIRAAATSRVCLLLLHAFGAYAMSHFVCEMICECIHVLGIYFVYSGRIGSLTTENARDDCDHRMIYYIIFDDAHISQTLLDSKWTPV